MMEAGGNDLGHGWPHWDAEDGPTIAARVPVRPDVEPVDARDLLVAALRQSWRQGFWAGVVFGGLLTGATFVASAAFSLDISGSVVALEPSAVPEAFADVVLHNDLSNGPTDTGSYTLAQDGFLIGVAFVWDANFIGMDQITVTPPAGMTCVPADCTATVVEGATGRVTPIQYVGS